MASFPQSICVLTHDLHPFGAQRVALSLARSLVETHRVHVEVVTVGGGDLSIPMRRHAPIHALGAHWRAQVRSLETLLPVLRQARVTHAITNTVIAAHFAAVLKQAGIEVLSLIHEMPTLISDEGLSDRLHLAHQYASHVVYPHEHVSSAIRSSYPSLANWDRVRHYAQGVESINPFRDQRIQARTTIRARLGLSSDAMIVLGIGTADRRKGFDLFLDAARAGESKPAPSNLHYVWIGPENSDVLVAWRQRNSGVSPRSIKNFHWLDYERELDAHYAGADLFVLSSREDPMPFVALEALNAGTPLLAFRGSGGGASLAARGCGRLVDERSSKALADAIESYLAAPDALRADGESGKALVDAEYRFDHYVARLLALFDPLTGASA